MKLKTAWMNGNKVIFWFTEGEDQLRYPLEATEGEAIEHFAAKLRKLADTMEAYPKQRRGT